MPMIFDSPDNKAVKGNVSLTLMAVGVYAASLLIPLSALDAVPVVLCGFRNITGMPCPGCGLTHAFLGLGHGDLDAAISYHALSPPLFVLGLIWLAREIAVLAGLRRWPVLRSRFRTRLVGMAALVLFSYGVWRMTVPSAWPYPPDGPKIQKRRGSRVTPAPLSFISPFPGLQGRAPSPQNVRDRDSDSERVSRPRPGPQSQGRE